MGKLTRNITNPNFMATQYRFLNDSTEFVFPIFREEGEKLINQFKNFKKIIDQDEGLDHVARCETERVVNLAYEATGNDVYIVSFCGEDKILMSTVMDYRAGGGFALEFDTSKLEEILQREGEKYSYASGHLSDVVYSDDEKKFKEELLNKLDDIAAFTKEIFPHMSHNTNRVPHDTKAIHSFVQCISRYKHCGFKEENEVRIVVLPTVQNLEETKLTSDKIYQNHFMISAMKMVAI